MKLSPPTNLVGGVFHFWEILKILVHQFVHRSCPLSRSHFNSSTRVGPSGGTFHDLVNYWIRNFPWGDTGGD